MNDEQRKEMNDMINCRNEHLISEFAKTFSESMAGVQQATLQKVNDMSKEFKAYVIEDTTWKRDQVQPVLNWFENFTIGKRLSFNFVKSVGWAAGIIIAIGGACAVIWALVKYAIIQVILGK
jgi:hypothetical protein